MALLPRYLAVPRKGFSEEHRLSFESLKSSIDLPIISQLQSNGKILILIIIIISQIDSHVLSNRKIVYGDNATAQVKNGAWNAMDLSYLKPAVKTHKWGILNTCRAGSQAIDDFVKNVCTMARKLKMDLGERANVKIENLTNYPSRENLAPIMDDFKKAQVEILFVIIPGYGDAYHNVKKEAELKYGILTQCLKKITLEKRNFSTLGNILLKVNTKLGGSNHRVEVDPEVKISSLESGPVMVIGADGKFSDLSVTPF